MTSNLMRVVGLSVSAANKAGECIRSIMKTGDLAVIDKSEKSEKFDPQTVADRTAQSIIIGSLANQFPELKIVGEEEDCDNASNELLVKKIDDAVLEHDCPEHLNQLQLQDLVVWVDPLDGTKEFTEGHVEHVTVLIGISANGKAIAGIIHQPFHKNTVGRTIWGVEGLGSFGITSTQSNPDRCIITTTKSHMTQEVQDAITALKPDEVLRTGGCGFKIIQLIEGIADIYVFATPGTRKWDTCAPEVVLRALGGELTDICGDRIYYDHTQRKFYMNWTGILATSSSRRHAKYATDIPDRIKHLLKEQQSEKLK